MYLLNNEKNKTNKQTSENLASRLKTRLYFLWNITTLVKNKHVWTCLKNMFSWNVAPHTILFTEISYKWTVSPCRYYEKQKQFHYCISSLPFFITFINSKTQFLNQNKVQIQVFFNFRSKKHPTIELEYPKTHPFFIEHYHLLTLDLSHHK